MWHRLLPTMWRAIFWECDMQLCIVVLLICGSCAYLLLKWLPTSRKQKLSAWLIRKVPQFNGVLSMPGDGCSGGCSSCGACEPTPMQNKTNKEIKIIRIVPNISRLN